MNRLEALPFAIYAAELSPCRSKRGVVIFNPAYSAVPIATGFNYQPSPFFCDGSARCKSTCHRTAVHAEQSALLDLGDYWSVVNDCHLLHVKVVDGSPVPSGPPSCLECSKLILESGIPYVWLLHEDGWKRYRAAEFHTLTAQYHGIELLQWKKVAKDG